MMMMIIVMRCDRLKRPRACSNCRGHLNLNGWESSARVGIIRCNWLFAECVSPLATYTRYRGQLRMPCREREREKWSLLASGAWTIRTAKPMTTEKWSDPPHMEMRHCADDDRRGCRPTGRSADQRYIWHGRGGAHTNVCECRSWPVVLRERIAQQWTMNAIRSKIQKRPSAGHTNFIYRRTRGRSSRWHWTATTAITKKNLNF